MTDEFLIKTAPLFDVHKWSDYPEVDKAVASIFEEIKQLRHLRNTRIREEDKVKKHLKVVIIDLWAAAKLGSNPYRAISKNKTSYQRESRYRRIFLKYDYLIPVIDDLIALDYITQNIGYYHRSSGRGKSTRIKATEKLLEKILDPEFGVDELISSRGYLSIVGNDGTPETIILRDQDGNHIEYEDTEATNLMRENLHRINKKLKATRIALQITDQQFEELVNRISSDQDPERREINFTNKQLCRIFNDSSFEKSGRFYGGWWQNIPKEYRKYITINHKPTVEIDYSGHHIRILYAEEGLQPPDDPYDLDVSIYPRRNQKEAILIMLNAADRRKAIAAMRQKGIRNIVRLVEAIEVRHSSIRQYFFSGIGLDLMCKDSKLAEAVMLRMLERGATVLPVHDSFIVRNSYDRELEEIMLDEFSRMFGATAKVKFKKTSLEEESDRRIAESGNSGRFVTSNLEDLLPESVDTYSRERELWGS